MAKLPAPLERVPSNPLSPHDPIVICLQQETQRFNRLLSVIEHSLKDLQGAVKGLIVMTAELDEMFTALSDGQVPGLWSRGSYASVKALASWFEDFLLRMDFFRDWGLLARKQAKEAYANQTVPPSAAARQQKIVAQNEQAEKQNKLFFWLSAFFFQQGFLTSVLQSFSRKGRIPIDTLQFGFEPCDFAHPEELEDETRQSSKASSVKGGGAAGSGAGGAAERGGVPNGGEENLRRGDGSVLIYGLFLDGAQWDYLLACLTDQDPGVFLNNPAPCIRFVPTERKAVGSSGDAGIAGSLRDEAGKTMEGGGEGGANNEGARAGSKGQQSDGSREEMYGFVCPVYKTPLRSGGHNGAANYLLAITLESYQKPNYWVLRGVALLTMLHD